MVVLQVLFHDATPEMSLLDCIVETSDEERIDAPEVGSPFTVALRHDEVTVRPEIRQRFDQWAAASRVIRAGTTDLDGSPYLVLASEEGVLLLEIDGQTGAL